MHLQSRFDVYLFHAVKEAHIYTYVLTQTIIAMHQRQRGTDMIENTYLNMF